MKRRNFLAALFVLPFAPKLLEAEPWVPKSAKRTPEEWSEFIKRLVDEKMQALNAKTFDTRLTTTQNDNNTVWVRANANALQWNVPSGWRKPMD